MLKYEHDSIVLIGDIHGKFRDLNFKIHKRHKLENKLFIQLGDFGVGFHKDGFYKQELSLLNSILKEHNNTLLALRGNHDNPDWFRNKYIDFSNLVLLSDYTLINTIKGNILAIGGAASIDKHLRTEGKSYWKDERPVLSMKRLENLEHVENIKYIVAHTNPHFCDPHVKYPTDDKKLEEYLDESRKTITYIYQYLQNFHCISHWYNGHYHWSSKEQIKETKFVTLDIMEFKELE